jgi:PhnB protein
LLEPVTKGRIKLSKQINEVFPYLRVRNADAAIEFYKQAFGATEVMRLTEPGGRIGHAELKFGNYTVMISDEYPEYGIQGPQAFGGTGSSIHLHVDDVDAMTKHAVEAGAKLLMEPKDQFYGERAAKVLDPFGHEWLLGTHIEDVTYEEMQRRFNAMMSGSECE